MSVYDAKIQQLQANTNNDYSLKKAQLSQLNLDKESYRQEHTYIAKLGHLIEPVIRPLGFDWKIGLSIISGLAAKEIVISTMDTLSGRY